MRCGPIRCWLQHFGFSYFRFTWPNHLKAFLYNAYERNSRQVWSRYGHTLPTYDDFAYKGFRDCATMTFNLLTLKFCQIGGRGRTAVRRNITDEKIQNWKSNFLKKNAVVDSNRSANKPRRPVGHRLSAIDRSLFPILNFVYGV